MDQKELKVPLANLGQLAAPSVVNKARREPLDLQVLLGHQVIEEPQGLRDNKEIEVKLVTEVNLEPRAQLDLKVVMVAQVRLVQMVIVALLVPVGSQDLLETLVTLASLAQTVPQVQLDHLDQRDQRDQQDHVVV